MARLEAHTGRDRAQIGGTRRQHVRSLRSPLFLLSIVAVAGLAATVALGQEGSPRSRAGGSLHAARECYTRGEYERADLLLRQVQVRATELAPTEQKDLAEVKRQNDVALQQRRDGAARLAQAEEAFGRGRLEETTALVKALSTNQYLTPTDKHKLGELTARMRSGGPRPAAPGVPPIKEDYNTLVAAGREACKRGAWDQAEQLAREAEQVGPRVPAWLHPWDDNPSRILRDAAAGRAKQTAAAPRENPRPPEKPNAPTPPAAPAPVAGEKPAPRGNGKPQDNAPLSKPSAVAQAPTPKGSGAMTAVGGEHAGKPQAREAQFRPASQTPPPNPETAQAMQLLQKGRAALGQKDFDTARKCAEQARALRPQLSWWDDSPDKLLAEVRRRAPASSPAVAESGRTPGGHEPADPRALLREGRGQFRQGNFDEADRLSLRAAAVPGARWGLFEDNPDRLRVDIQKARARKDGDAAARLLAEARKHFQEGDLAQAKAKAYQSKRLHGPYSIWEMGDRPDRLLADINKVEIAQRNKGTDVPADRPAVAQQKPDAAKGPARPEPTVVALQAKQRAQGLLLEARGLQRQGKLVEARQKTVEAHQWAVEAARGNVRFQPGEEGPELVLNGLGLACANHIDGLVRQADDCVRNGPKDPNTLKAAGAHLAQARYLANAFGLETQEIDARSAWIQQAQVALVAPPAPGGNGGPLPTPGGQGVALAGAQVPAPGGAGDPKRREGLDLLEKGRLEVTRGQLFAARKIGEQVFEGPYGLRDEAGRFLNAIDLEEFNQKRNHVNRKFDDGLDAFQRRDYNLARTVFAGLKGDETLLTQDRQDRLRELSGTPEMQPGQVAKAPAGAPVQQASVPGRAVATDRHAKASPKAAPTGDDLADRVKAIEEIQFQQLYNEGLEDRRRAITNAKAGEFDAAMDVLRAYLERLEGSSLSKERVATLGRPFQRQLDEYRKLKAQKDWEQQQASTRVIGGGREREKKRLFDDQKRQEEVADLIKQCTALMRQGQIDKGLVLAYRAREIDPDNVAVDAVIQMGKIRREVQKGKVKKDENEDFRLKAWHDAERLGPYVDGIETPLAFNKDITEQAQKRKGYGGGIFTDRLNERERQIERKLLGPVSLNFKDTPLSQVIEDLGNITGVNVVPDTFAFQEGGINDNQPVTLRVDNISLKSALNMLLRKVRLTYMVKDEALQITTEDHAKGKTKVVTYPVGDLVVPVPNHSLPVVADFSGQMARHYAGNTAPNLANASPILTPNSLNGGQPVGTGNGAPAQGNGLNGPPKPPGSTIEDLLIKLITTTIDPQSWNEVGGKGTIQYFPLGMALVINQIQDVQEQIQDLLAALRRLQDLEVAIEMRLVSVSESFFERMAFDFDLNIINRGQTRWEQQLVTQQFAPPGFINAFKPDGFFSGLTPAGTFTPDLGVPIRASSFDFSLPPFGGYPGTLGADGGLSLGLAFLSDVQVFMLLEAAQGDRRYNLMQAPKLTVFNGQTATITASESQFFLTQINVVAFGSQLVFQPQNSPILTNGVSMFVTPVVSADRRFVRLNIIPQISNLTSANVPLLPVQIPVNDLFFDGIVSTQPRIFQTFFQQPGFSFINVQATVVVPDGGTVLMGGLKTLSEGRNEFGPPLLSKIPYVNRLFKNVGYGRETTSMMLLVTARIIINEEEEQIYLGNLTAIPGR